VVKSTQGWSTEHPGMYRIALDTESNDPAYVRGTFHWHIDGATLETPVKASVLSARVLSAEGGDTQFASTYTAYDHLTEDEKSRIGSLKVWHSVFATVRDVQSQLAPEALERMRKEPARLHPLVWTHRSGRKSLVIGLTASHIEGLPEEDGIALLAQLLERATTSELVYSHHWEVGDLVIWDNRGALHRVDPYDSDSGREMHRVNLAGDEPIQ
jgi:alpha-ketoglutarate-dependent taurine dioxygenase